MFFVVVINNQASLKLMDECMYLYEFSEKRFAIRAAKSLVLNKKKEGERKRSKQVFIQRDSVDRRIFMYVYNISITI